MVAQSVKAPYCGPIDQGFETNCNLKSFLLQNEVKMSKYLKSDKLLYQTNKYSSIFHRFEVNQRNIGLYFIDLKLYFSDSQLKSRKYRSQISKVK